MSNLDLNTFVEQTAQALIARLGELGLSPEEYQSDSGVLMQFAGIAAGQLLQEPGIEGPDPDNPIPLDDNMMAQGVVLFCEGLYFALTKSASMGITGPLKQDMLQTLAMHIYDQAKQIVAATYGQEHTPEFQFTMQQQIDIIQKATEGYMMAMITEYENEHGPIIPELPPEMLAASGPDMPSLPASAPQPKQQQAANPTRAKGPSSHDKYAAVALLLGTMSSDQRIRLLKVFSDDEKELITYYSYPQHVEQNLDLASVESHLKKLKASLKKSGGRTKSAAYTGIMALVASYPQEKLLSLFKDERPLVKRYLESYYSPPSGPAMSQAERRPGKTDPLPPRIEEILYQFLAKRLNP